MSKPLVFVDSVKAILRRFHPQRGTARDLEWMDTFSKQHNTDIKMKVKVLGIYLKQIEYCK